MQNLGGSLGDPDIKRIFPDTKEEQAKQAYLNSLGKPVPGELTTTSKPAIPDHATIGPGQDVIRKCTERVQRIHEKRVHEITLRYNGLLSKIRDLQNEIDALEESPLTKQDLADQAKKTLKEMRENMRVRLIKEHLESCQNRRSIAFSEPAMSVLFDGKEFLLSYLILTEKDIDKAIQLLPDVGLPREEREAKIKSLQKQIAKLSKIISDEFEQMDK